MENASEALRMAAGVLIFVLALSISINAFSKARVSIDEMVKYTDREYLSTYIEKNNGTHRIVGAESIVPTIYRAYKENYKINFDFLKNTPDYLYKREKTDGTTEEVTYIDLERENIADETVKEYIIKRILFGKKAKDDNLEKRVSSRIEFDDQKNEEGLYSKIKGKTYEEFLGIYYQEETNGAVDQSTVNKTVKRVITYKDC